MKMVAFVMWVVGWWISYDLCAYLQALKHKVDGGDQPGTGVNGFEAIFALIVWLVVGIALWNKL